MERPGLKKLLDDIAAGKIDIVSDFESALGHSDGEF